ncbi:MAG: hypothetical protein ACRDQ0_20440 [Pseudonocardia sp.]
MALDNTRNTATTEHATEDENRVDENRVDENRVDENPVTEPAPEDPPTGGVAPEEPDTAPDTAAETTDDGLGAGAAAVVSAGLAVASLTGTGVGDMLRARAEIVGQIEASVGGGAVDQVAVLYGSPWDTAALVNGAIALVALVIGAVVQAAHSGRPATPTWVRAVALGGVVLGGIGLLVAAGMYFDLFAAAPELPRTPTMGG